MIDRPEFALAMDQIWAFWVHTHIREFGAAIYPDQPEKVNDYVLEKFRLFIDNPIKFWRSLDSTRKMRFAQAAHDFHEANPE